MYHYLNLCVYIHHEGRRGLLGGRKELPRRVKTREKSNEVVEYEQSTMIYISSYIYITYIYISYIYMKMSWWISSFSRLTKTIKSKKPAIHPKTRHHIMIMGAGPLETTSMQQPLSSAVVYLFSGSDCGEVSCCLQRFRGFYPLIIVSILFIMFCVIYFIFTSFPVLKI